MPILITIGILALYVFWVVWGRRTAQNEVASKLDPLWSKIKQRSSCKWSTTGDSNGRFVEYRCATCGVSAMTHTGAAPKDCKRGLKAGL